MKRSCISYSSGLARLATVYEIPRNSLFVTIPFLFLSVPLGSNRSTLRPPTFPPLALPPAEAAQHLVEHSSVVRLRCSVSRRARGISIGSRINLARNHARLVHRFMRAATEAGRERGRTISSEGWMEGVGALIALSVATPVRGLLW